MGGMSKQVKSGAKKQLWSYQTPTTLAQADYVATMNKTTRSALVDEIVRAEVESRFKALMMGYIGNEAEARAIVLADTKLRELLETLAIKVGVGPAK